MARAELRGDAQDVGGPGAGAQRPQVGELDRRTIGHRIGKGHPQLDHVGTAFDQRVEDRSGGVRRGVAAGDESDEGGAALGEGV